MKQTEWKVEGMTCSNCALSVSKYLKQQGMQNVSVNAINGKVSFEHVDEKDLTSIKSGIADLGYTVAGDEEHQQQKPKWLENNKQRFLFTMPFTLLLMMHMLHTWLPIHWLMNPLVQMMICLPVFVIGMHYFGRSAVKSLQNGIPNMNVLVCLGALVSFVYSIAIMATAANHHPVFFETTASIISLVFLGNYLEEATMQSTQKALRQLVKSQKVMANMIAFDDQHQEQIFPIENNLLKTGDLILIKTGEQIPVDCKILWGECSVNESIITGESIPVTKTKKDVLIGGSMLESGTVKAQVTATGKDTVLSGILSMVHNAQAEKPPMQKLADRISAIFVPVVIGVSVLTFLANRILFDVATFESLMRAVAVLVISCPCAMGLATPAAISVGLGRAARRGIIFRNATGLENFKKINQVVFDKTGTLTTGKFIIQRFHTSLPETDFKSVVISLEKYSNHPIAKSVVKEWKTAELIRWKKVEEVKGMGVKGEDINGDIYEIGSRNEAYTNEDGQYHNIHVYKNGKEIGWADVSDELRPEAASVVNWLNTHGIKTILLTGDHKDKADAVASTLGIKEVYSSHTPEMKLKKIVELNKLTPVAMVGDGINDAPALASATIGISMSEAADLATQHADVILMNNGLKHLPEALGLGKHTFLTIQQNLFWAFSYNIIAIPVAALGLLTPTFSAMAMGFSDIMLALISLRLFVKKVS